jgi:hypothetical protein
MLKLSNSSVFLAFVAFSFIGLDPIVSATSIKQRSLTEFEVSFSGTLDSKPHETVKLIGYKTVHVPPEELESFNADYNENHAEWIKLTNAYYDPDNGTLRVYFPVEHAVVEHGDTITEASELGGLNITIHTEIAVLGRKQTEHVRGVDANIIKDGMIYLAEKNRPHHTFENVFVFDFGEKSLNHDHHGLHKRDEEGHTSCMKNHGGPNCSDKFNIHNGRCARRHDVCVDYNGYWTNCKKGGSRWKNFPGSDCFTALARGHCWNEVM